MITQAISLAILTFSGFYVIYKKLPQKVKDFFCKFNLLTDVMCLAGAYFLLGGTVTALFAAAIVGLATSVALYIGQNKDDFEYLWDLAEAIKDLAAKVKIILKEQGIKYREEKNDNPADLQNQVPCSCESDC